MKNTAIKALVTVSAASMLLVTLPGCSDFVWPGLSIHPLYSDGDTVFEPALLGTWMLKDAAGRYDTPNEENDWFETFEFVNYDDASYLLRHSTSNSKASYFKANLVEIDGHFFLDVFPDEANSEDPGGTFRFNSQHILVHAIYYIEQLEPELVMREMNSWWVDELLEENPDAIPHLAIEDEYDEYRYLLNAPTPELQAFCVANIETEDAYVNNEDGNRTFVQVETELWWGKTR